MLSSKAHPDIRGFYKCIIMFEGGMNAEGVSKSMLSEVHKLNSGVSNNSHYFSYIQKIIFSILACHNIFKIQHDIAKAIIFTAVHSKNLT